MSNLGVLVQAALIFANMRKQQTFSQELCDVLQLFAAKLTGKDHLFNRLPRSVRVPLEGSQTAKKMLLDLCQATASGMAF